MPGKRHSFHISAIVLKRSNFGETDRVVTVLSQELGKISVVAKGVRKLNSSRTASLEPGCLVDMFCLQSHGLPLVSQTKLIIDTQAIRTDLIQIKRFFQVLEIFDQLFVEESLDENTFGLVLNIHQSLLNHDSHQHVQSQLQELLQLLGFGSQSHLSISDQVSQLTNHKLHSFAFLTTSG